MASGCLYLVPAGVPGVVWDDQWRKPDSISVYYITKTGGRNNCGNVTE
jgi:hypothetical protein